MTEFIAYWEDWKTWEYGQQRRDFDYYDFGVRPMYVMPTLKVAVDRVAGRYSVASRAVWNQISRGLEPLKPVLNHP